MLTYSNSGNKSSMVVVEGEAKVNIDGSSKKIYSFPALRILQWRSSASSQENPKTQKPPPPLTNPTTSISQKPENKESNGRVGIKPKTPLFF